MIRDLITPAERLDPRRDKRADAVRYLRERGRYCLDRPVPRLPAPERPLSLLDRWIATRRAA
jgi:hypothetical protein